MQTIQEWPSHRSSRASLKHSMAAPSFGKGAFPFTMAASFVAERSYQKRGGGCAARWSRPTGSQYGYCVSGAYRRFG